MKVFHRGPATISDQYRIFRIASIHHRGSCRRWLLCKSIASHSEAGTARRVTEKRIGRILRLGSCSPNSPWNFSYDMICLWRLFRLGRDLRQSREEPLGLRLLPIRMMNFTQKKSFYSWSFEKASKGGVAFKDWSWEKWRAMVNERLQYEASLILIL